MRKPVKIALAFAAACLIAGSAILVAVTPRAGWTTSKASNSGSRDYPDLAPRVYDLDPDNTLTLAVQVASGLPGWRVVRTDRAAGQITATVGVPPVLPLFTDDVVIRVSPEGRNTRLVIESASRIGRADLGENARHIRAFLRALDQRVNPVSPN